MTSGDSQSNLAGDSPDQTDWSAKKMFTTGEAAEVCRVSQQTIIRCFDSGRLAGFRVPGSRFRRIPRDELIGFMRRNGIPTDSIERPKRRVLVVTTDADTIEGFASLARDDERFIGLIEIEFAHQAFDAGIRCATWQPSVVVLGSDVPGLDAVAAVERLRAIASRPSVIAITDQPDRRPGKSAAGSAPAERSWPSTGVSAVLRSPVSCRELADIVLTHLQTDASDSGG